MPQTAPNILLILTDQQRSDTISAHGSSFGAPTPHMDRLYRQGVFFDSAFCASPICGPSRASIMTGLHPAQTNVYANLGNPCGPLSTQYTTIAQRLQAQGYQTAYHGKWHVGGDLSDYGFEVAYENGHDPSTLTEAARFWRNRDWITHRRPFFQVVSFLDPHDIYFYDPDERPEPTLAPWPSAADTLKDKPWPQQQSQVQWTPQRWEAYRRFYGQRLTRVDAHIGQLIQELTCSGFAPNTWIILTSDHGDMGGEHGLPFKGPFVYDGVVRVPLLIIPPMGRFAGPARGRLIDPPPVPHVCHDLASLVDLVPTFLDLAGGDIPTELPGRSLMSGVYNRPGDRREAVFAEWHQFGQLVTPIRMIRTHDWKYTEYLGQRGELYDLRADPHEMQNLVDDPSHAGQRDALRTRLLEHLNQTHDPFFTHRPSPRPPSFA